ncbi:MAG: hypothetical protein BWX47_01899 [candidate division Hyd24-12 bacterium ADurb.Bin004]|nr:MAG: hypothetical protein BWX47_01899 [candidate division Hyd24-12 bacterium ADurb.Bin004]
MRGARATGPLEWLIRVVVRSRTGVSNFSEMSRARAVRSRASALSEGSSIGTLAALAKCLLSCSFCEECMPGSSAETTTIPPVAPM